MNKKEGKYKLKWSFQYPQESYKLSSFIVVDMFRFHSARPMSIPDPENAQKAATKRQASGVFKCRCEGGHLEKAPGRMQT